MFRYEELSTLRKLILFKKLIASGGIKVVSGAIASFVTKKAGKAISVLDSIEPIQDLHGYDKPWSGGNGKNKLSPASTSGANIDLKGVTATIASDGSITLNGTATDVGFIQVPISNPLPIKEYTATMFNTVAVANKAIQFSLRQQNVKDSAGGWFAPNTVGRTFTFTPTAEAYWWQIQIPNGAVLSNSKISPMLVEGSTAPTTYEPYSNICPISGHTEVVTSRCGVNVWDEIWELGSINGTTGENQALNDRFRSKNFIRCLPNASYYIKSASKLNLRFYDSNKGFISSRNDAQNIVITTPANAGYIRFATQSGYTTYNDDISINYPSTDTDYHAYNGTSYTTALGQTVYGGTLDVVSGVLTVDRANIDMGSLTWTYSNSFFRTDGITATVKRPPNNQTNVNAICSAYPIMTWTAISGTDTAIAVDTTGRMIVANPNITSLSDFQTAISGVQLCYELATPQTIQLSPQEVELLKGQNNLWCDSGEIQVTYKG